MMEKILVLVAFLIASCSSAQNCGDKFVLKKPVDLSQKSKVSIKGKYCFLSSSSTNPEETRVKILAVDRNTGKPLKVGVNISKELQIGGFTDDEGYFETTIPQGDYKIEVFLVGRPSIITSLIQLKTGTTTSVYFYVGIEKVS